MRSFSKIDQVIQVCDNFLKTNFGGLEGSGRENPAGELKLEKNASQSTKQNKLTGRLMRINHSGEVAAQGLYQGQMFLESDTSLKKYLEQAAKEEGDHLIWTSDYLRFKRTRNSLFNPVWYLGSFTLGLYMRTRGIQKSKSFLAETERQVQQHLKTHIDIFPKNEEKADKILKKMFEDEGEHANWAENRISPNGKNDLSNLEKRLMRTLSKVMIEVSKRI